MKWHIAKASMVEREMTDRYYCCERGGCMAYRWCIVIKQAGSRLKRCDDGAMVGHCDCDWLLEITSAQLVGHYSGLSENATFLRNVPNYGANNLPCNR